MEKAHPKELINFNPLINLNFGFIPNPKFRLSIIQAQVFEFASFGCLSTESTIYQKMIQESASRKAGTVDLNKAAACFSSPPPIEDRLGQEKFKDTDASTANRRFLNHFRYRHI